MEKHELLLRQIHPSWIQNGLPSFLAFKPTKKDAGKLSVYQGSMMSPKEAYDHYTETLHLASDSVWGITVAECDDIGLSALPDPQTFTEHAIIDFNGKSLKKQEEAAKQLKARAIDRGCLYRP